MIEKTEEKENYNFTESSLDWHTKAIQSFSQVLASSDSHKSLGFQLGV